MTKNLRQLTAKELSGMTWEQVTGRPELQTANYTAAERQGIELLLLQLGLLRNEDIVDRFDIYINEFSALNIRAYEVMQRVKMAKLEKKYGELDFSVFMNVNIEHYGKYFKVKGVITID